MNVLPLPETTGAMHAFPSELHALAAECGVYRVDRTLVALGGRDRVRWLNAMVSNNIRDLAAGRGVYAFVLNPQGQIQGDLYAFNRGETLVLEIDRAQAGLLPQLRRYIIMDKVEVQELGNSVVIFGIAGAKATQVLQSVGIAAPEAPLGLAEASWSGVRVTVLRGDNPCVANYELWVPQEHAGAFRTALLQAGAQEVHQAALDAFRILCGIPKFGIDIRERTLPQETAQDRALNFNKGCYIGQEIVERIRARGSVHRMLTGFEVTGSAPATWTPIQADGKDVGVLTSTATIPTSQGDHVVALGLLRKEQLTQDASFEISGTILRPVSLPFSNLIQQL